MQYRPFWERIFFLAVVLHFIFLIGVFAYEKFSLPQTEKVDDIEELEWVEVEVDSGEEIAESEPEIPNVAEIFPEIEIPPIEIPPPPEPAVTEPPPPETKAVATNSGENTDDSQKAKSDEDKRGKLIVLTKVFPKDVVPTLISSGAINERPILNSGKIVIAITIDIKGKVKNIEIRRGGGTDEHGNLINLVSEAAAAGWTFEPYQDEDGNIKEMKTQIEFKPEDF